jgi:hypothetical protein
MTERPSSPSACRRRFRSSEEPEPFRELCMTAYIIARATVGAIYTTTRHRASQVGSLPVCPNFAMYVFFIA